MVFTNGVFDLIHPGHVACLEEARAEGGALVVGVNSDRSVRGLAKGRDRPLMPEDQRLRLVAALDAVDRVVAFDEPTPLELIRSLGPDILVKGGDYRPSEVVGADWVTAQGGRVHITRLVPDISTTALLERLRGTT